MELPIISETFETLIACCAVLFLSLSLTFFACRWIDSVYTSAQNSDLLSYPERVIPRSRFRKPLLFLLLVCCISKAWYCVTWPALFYFVIAIALLSVVTVTDFEQYVIFDVMLLPLALCGIGYTLHLHLPFWNHIVAGLGGGFFFFFLTLITHGAIGGGDIKLIAALGLWLGVRPLLSVITYGFIAGGIAALFLLITKQKNRHDYFAYGPYFALSGIGVLLGWIHKLF